MNVEFEILNLYFVKPTTLLYCIKESCLFVIEFVETLDLNN